MTLRFLGVYFLCCTTLFAQSGKTNVFRDTVSDVYFSDKVSDPYQWMEGATDPHLAPWLEQQQKKTSKKQRSFSRMWTLRTQLATIYNKGKVEERDNYVEKDGRFQSKYEFDTKIVSYKRTPDLLYRVRGSKNYKSLVKIKSLQKFKEEHILIHDHIVNTPLDLVAIVISRDGTDWREVHFYNLLTGEKLEDQLQYLRNSSSLVWDGNGLYYDRYSTPINGGRLTETAKGQTVYYHHMGKQQSHDKSMYTNPDRSGVNRFIFSKLGEDKLLFSHFYTVRNVIYKAMSFVQMKQGDSFFLKNFMLYPNDVDAEFSIATLLDNTLVLKTNWNAPNGKVFAVDITGMNQITELIPEYDIDLREVNRLGKDKLACVYRKKGEYSVLIFDFQGQLLKKITYPEGKVVRGFYENDTNATHTEFSIASYFHPDLWFQISLDDLSVKPSRTTWTPFDANDLETRYVTYTSKDGVAVPMYVTCLKKTKLNGKNPTLLYGYGGYGITVEPSYSKEIALWLLHGGIYAVPNIRGGGGKGLAWEKAGKRLNKQNAISDFIAAAEYLIENKYTSPEKLGIKGGSHGGMLVGAAITQRPELFKTAIAEAGIFDMLRWEKYTVGGVATNLLEFGSVTDKDEYDNLKSFSPLHNLKEGVHYPNTLLVTGDKDDRVLPFHSYKFLASLQEKSNSNSEHNLYVVPGAGHGGALTHDDWVNKTLFTYYYLFDQLKLRFW